MFDKGSKEYYKTLIENLELVATLFGDKLAKLIIYNQALTDEEKKARFDDLKKWLSKADKNWEVVKIVESQVIG